MRVLITGANGFIGQHLTATLLRAGHTVTVAVRHMGDLKKRFPEIHTILNLDLNKAIQASDWAEAVDSQDAVINCAGVLQQSGSQNIWNIHHKGPAALFQACEDTGVKKVVQISAISADQEAGTDYALSKLAGDNDLRARGLDWVVLRPSLVIAENAYGGTALLRRLASFPFFVPVIGKGDQVFQAIMIDDLCQIVTAALSRKEMNKKTIDVVGPETLETREILLQMRLWLGRSPAPFLGVPVWIVRLAARVGDVLGLGPMRSTALIHTLYGNVGGKNALNDMIELTGVRPKTLGEFFKNNKPGRIGR